ncbi:MAG: spondin domain-containing protein [Nitrospinota bacterium]|nr:spondin domain-containing protein [Nitrospinota bacterium]
MTRAYAMVGVMMGLALLDYGCAAGEDDKAESRAFHCTIKNLTPGQIFTPPILILHGKDYSLFTPGGVASPGLTWLAEDGVATTLLEELRANPGVTDVITSSQEVHPGKSITIEFIATANSMLSATGMLETTNDAFLGARNLTLPESGSSTVKISAYDAGTEENNELCAYVPGPPCGSNKRALNGEGTIHMHVGILGVGDLAPGVYGWEGDVAEIVITAIDN